MSERYDHGKNFSGKIRIQLFTKSFIQQVYDVLERHSHPCSSMSLKVLETCLSR
jgi:hypothetical protein